MDLSETMRQAVADPPPSSIDLDRLIRGERLRERRQRWLAGVGAAAGVAVVIGATSAALTGRVPPYSDGVGAPPCPGVSDNPPATAAPAHPGFTNSPVPRAWPAPTEPCGLAVSRLDLALTEALHGVLPSATLTNAEDARRAPVSFQPTGFGYEAMVIVRDGDREARIHIVLDPRGASFAPPTACENPAPGCSLRTVADGAVVMVHWSDAGHLPGGSGDVFRPDGTVVSARVFPNTCAPGPLYQPCASPVSGPRLLPQAMSAEWLQTLVTNPALTLYP